MIALLLALLFGFGLSDNPTVPQSVLDDLAVPVVSQPPDACRQDLFKHTVDALGDGPDVTFVWADLTAHHAAGLAYMPEGVIALDSSAALPCWAVPAVIHHEWGHQLTAEYFGSYDKAAVEVPGGKPELEILADCVSHILTVQSGHETYAPYADKAGGCTPARLELAQRIIYQR